MLNLNLDFIEPPRTSIQTWYDLLIEPELKLFWTFFEPLTFSNPLLNFYLDLLNIPEPLLRPPKTS